MNEKIVRIKGLVGFKFEKRGIIVISKIKEIIVQTMSEQLSELGLLGL